jgi:DNA-binding transcriptional ArsR family regulator
LIAQGERSVNDIARLLGITQPQASKHLAVLKQVGLVTVRAEGQQRWYALSSQGLKPIHDWVKSYERFWNESFDRLADYLDELQHKENPV